MNKVFDVIWSKAHNAWVVVSEGTKACSKSGASRVKVALVASLLVPASTMAAPLPTGGSITSWQGSIAAGSRNIESGFCNHSHQPHPQNPAAEPMFKVLST